MPQHVPSECSEGNHLSELFGAAADAADEILRTVYFVDIRKALNPLVAHDYVQIVKHLAKELMGHVVPVEKNAMRKAVESLDVDWHNLNKEQRANILDEAKKYLVPLPEQVLPKIDQTLVFAAKDIIANTKSKAVLKYDLKISPKLSEFDQRVSKVLRASQGNFIRDQFGKRIDHFSGTARDIVANGLEQGYGSKAIAAELSQKLQQAGRGDGYWNLIAMVHANRARTMTQLGSFHEAGIVSFRVESVLDEVTSVQCRFMHGKVFPVQTGMQHFQDAENAMAASPDDPNVIKEMTPFLNHGGAAGAKSIYIPDGDGRINVAQVVASAVGEKDKVGSFGNGKDVDKLAALGISCPPFHGHCRTTIVPVFGEASGAPTKAPPAPPPPKPKPTAAELQQNALDKLNTLPSQWDGMVDCAPLIKVGPDFMKQPFSTFEISEMLGKEGKSKKIALSALRLTSDDIKADKDKIAALIKDPKKLADALIEVGEFEGKQYLVGGKEAVLAHKLMGTKQVSTLHGSIDKMVAAQPVALPPSPPPVTSKPLVSADNILHEKTGGPAGSNDGGFYTGKDGVKRYVKFYKDRTQAASEHLSNQIYAELGLGAPNTVVFEHNGGFAYASDIIEDVKTLGHAPTVAKEHAEEVLKGFVGDVLMANWDVVGMKKDNIVVSSAGKVFRIDNGGSFLIRAQGLKKNKSVLNMITEWDGFFSPSINPSYAAVAKTAGIGSASDLDSEHLVKQIHTVTALREKHGGWDNYVAKFAPLLVGADRDDVVSMLEARTTLLAAKADELIEELKLPKLPKPIAHGDFKAPAGVRVKPPALDENNLAVRKFEQLSTRRLPNLDTPPDGSDVDAYKRLAAQNIEKASSASREAIHDFTGSTYSRIREAQRAGDTTSVYGRLGASIEQAFATVPPVPGQVFRGIRDLDRRTIDLLMNQDEIAMLGTASSSRTSDVAVNTFMGGTSGSDWRVLFVIHQKSGIAIETISGLQNENEILLSKNTRFRVLNRHRAEENSRAILILEIEEITNEQAPDDRPAKKPRKPRRKPGSDT